MKWLKTFETFDFSQTLPLASKSDLTLYYHCDDCDSLFKDLNNQITDCKNCKGSRIEELSKDEWWDTVGERLDDDKKEDLESEREKDNNTFIDLYNLGKNVN